MVEQKIKKNFKHVIPGVIERENSGHIVEVERQLDTSRRSNDVADDSILLDGVDPSEN